jgi:uncharacterized protein YlxW (UPF0749 family)
MAGLLLVTSAVSSDGRDLRPGRFVQLSDIADAEAAKLERLRTEQADLAAEVDRLTQQLAAPAGDLQDAIEALEGPAGLTAVSGPGITVVLDDAPEAAQDSLVDLADASQLVVHEQDIQAVVNALWAGGAEAMTIQGQRVISTTGIRCVGNTVILQDVPYAPPYVVSAIGPTDDMLGALATSPGVQSYLAAVEKFQLSWEVRVEPEILAPAFEGSTTLEYARPVTEFGAKPDDADDAL